MLTRSRGALRRFIILFTVVLAVAGAIVLGGGATHTGRAASDVTVYADALSPAWTASVRGASVDLAATGNAYGGSRAIAVDFGGGWSELTLEANQTLLMGDTAHLRFSFYASDARNNLELVARDGNGDPVGNPYRVPLAPGAWLTIDLSLDALGNPAAIKSLTWQKGGNKAPQPGFYLDEIRLLDIDGVPIGAATAAPTTAPAQPTQEPTVAPTATSAATTAATATDQPTVTPTATTVPTTAPTATEEPTAAPTATATTAPTATATAPAAAPSGQRISWAGGNWYTHGVNVPWVNWAQDFGGDQYGLASQILKADGSLDTSSEIVQRFAQLPGAGVHAVNWWLFSGSGSANPSGPQQIVVDANGVPTGIRPEVYRDIDAALKLADAYDLYYTFPVLIRPNQVPLSWLTTQRTAFVNALRPMFQRYSGNPRIMAWSAFVEPEWTIWNEGFSRAVAQDYVRDFAAAVHAESNQLVTLNSAMLDGLPMWTGLGLDFYSASWYDYMNNLTNSHEGDGGNWCALCTTYEEVRTRYNLDKPLVIGEFYAGASATYYVGGDDLGPLGRLNAWYDKGYAGTYAWSLFPEKTDDRLAIEWNSYSDFGGAHDDTGPR